MAFLLGGDDVKQQKRVQITAIQETTAEGFTQAMNLELEKRNEPKITYITSVPFTAYIEYTETVEVPESLREKYELNHDTRYCSQCPYFQRTKDKRYKWHFCIQKQKAVLENGCACETYYQLLEELIKEGIENV